MKNKKGFTLIELLIVIAIIGILAVAFLPSILGAPAKGRDAARIADLQKIQKVLVNYNLQGKDFPGTAGDVKAIVPGLLTGYSTTPATNTWSLAFGPDFGGVIPDDPQDGYDYTYIKSPTGYSFGVYAKMEIFKNANSDCATVAAGGGAFGTPTDGTPSTYCYVIYNK